MSGSVRVLVCDDHPIVREALRSRLDAIPGIKVVGEAADGREAIRRVRLTGPDLALVDIEMPGLDGISTTRKIAELSPLTRVLIVTAHEDPRVVALAAEAGAAGYLLKSSTPEQTREAVLTVADGGSWFPGGMPRPDEGDELALLRSLTARERQILDLLAIGLRAEGIAGEIGISRATVYTHVRNTVAKLGVETRAQAVALATRYAFIQPEA